MREPNLMLLGAGLLLALFALVLLWRSSSLKAATGLPPGRVIASDMGDWHPVSENLVARDLKLTGRPDYLIEQPDGLVIPVEVKSRAAPDQPYESHVLQLAAYCLLAERHFGARPTHGIIQYEDRAFSVTYTPALERDVLNLLAEMREDLYEPEINRDHDDSWRCNRCGYAGTCGQQLA